jgi:hypothetical protein
MEIKQGFIVAHPSRPGERLVVKSILNGKAACKSSKDAEFECKEYAVDELELISRQPRGPLKPHFG